MNKNKRVLEVKNISKRFGGVKALEQIDLYLDKGETLGLVGENGAGKSTLIKILAGAIKPDSGDIYLDGNKVEINDPRAAMNHGIGVIYQEFNLVPPLSVAKNLFLGNPPVNKLFRTINENKLNKDAHNLLISLGVDINPRALVRDISVAQKQIVEICKALTFSLKIIILDEPTSALTGNEIEQLFKLLNELKKMGISIIFVSHRLEEVIRIADRINVLRNGRMVSNKKREETNLDNVIQDMIGRGLEELYPKTKVTIGNTVLDVKGFGDGKVFESVSFYLKEGEIIGIAGLVGAGRTELLKSLFGARMKTNGQVLINSREVKINNTIDSIRAGIVYIPEDRKTEGLIPVFVVSNNIILANLKKVSWFAVLRSKKIKDLVLSWVENLKIATYNPMVQKVTELSGGNQQKVVIAKWLATGARILLMDEPTRGIDIGTKAEIHSLIGNFLKEGNCVILVSSDVDELISVSDRIYVMRSGRFRACFERNEITKEKLMSCMLGTSQKGEMNLI
jgi:ABC-type sugar transport system ATPase subunit